MIYDLIRKWGVDKGIIGTNGKATRFTQIEKLDEEFSELCDAIDDDNLTETQDAIGDMTVVLVILANLCGLKFEDCVQSAYDEIKDRKGTMVNGLFVKQP